MTPIERTHYGRIRKGNWLVSKDTVAEVLAVEPWYNLLVLTLQREGESHTDILYANPSKPCTRIHPIEEGAA